MRVERGRGALVAVAEPEAGAADAAAQAFERLGAEVTILRRAMESLAAAVVEARPVDPTPTLEAMAARLERVETRLRSVEEQPALAQTAETQRAGVEGVVEESLRAPLQAFQAPLVATNVAWPSQASRCAHRKMAVGAVPSPPGASARLLHRRRGSWTATASGRCWPKPHPIS